MSHLDKKIAFVAIATNKYINFLDNLLTSADEYFLINNHVEYIVLTNNNKKINTKRKLNFLKIEHEPWPAPTLKRYDYFYQYFEYLRTFDYIFYCDADMKFVDFVDVSILGDLVGTLHPGFFNSNPYNFTYERNPNSKAYVPYGQGLCYYAGGFNGGNSDTFLKMAKTIFEWKKIDESNNIIPVWHDESYMNRYMIDNPPSNILSPSYCYPESWNIPFKKILLALDKNHKEIRA